MMYFLDTNICIYFLKAKSISLKEKILSCNPNHIKIPSVVQAELLYGAEKSLRRNENIEKINQFLFPFDIIGFNTEEAKVYSIIRSELERKGTIIGPNDLMIASIAAANGGILITNNTREFQRVRGLPFEDWSEIL